MQTASLLAMGLSSWPWNWADFKDTNLGLARTVDLPLNGHFAVLAFAAGPGRAHEIPNVYAPVMEVCGDGPATFSIPTDEDKEDIHFFLTTYLADADIPEPPKGVTWRLALPAGMSFDYLQTFQQRVFDTVLHLHGAEQTKEAAIRLRVALSRLYNESS